MGVIHRVSFFFIPVLPSRFPPAPPRRHTHLGGLVGLLLRPLPLGPPASVPPCLGGLDLLDLPQLLRLPRLVRPLPFLGLPEILGPPGLGRAAGRGLLPLLPCLAVLLGAGGALGEGLYRSFVFAKVCAGVRACEGREMVRGGSNIEKGLFSLQAYSPSSWSRPGSPTTVSASRSASSPPRPVRRRTRPPPSLPCRPRPSRSMPPQPPTP